MTQSSGSFPTVCLCALEVTKFGRWPFIGLRVWCTDSPHVIAHSVLSELDICSSLWSHCYANRYLVGTQATFYGVQ